MKSPQLLPILPGMTIAAAFFRSTGWRVFIRLTIPVLLAISLGKPHSWPGGFDLWRHNFLNHYEILSYPINSLFGLPRYVVFIPFLLVYGAVLLRLWRTGNPWALIGALLLTAFGWALHIAFALPI